MKSAFEVYRRSLALLGQEEGENTDGFEKRAPDLINLLLARLTELDLNLKGNVESPYPLPQQIDSLEDLIGLEEVIVLSALPIGLAALLIQEEEPERASYFTQLFEKECGSLRQRCRKGRRHKIRRSF
jgi:hypothetical protein